MQLYYYVQVVVSVVLEVRCLGTAIVYQLQLVQIAVSVFFLVEVGYWECPLMESPLYLIISGCNVHGELVYYLSTIYILLSPTHYGEIL